jgi:hypothetical protein
MTGGISVANTSPYGRIYDGRRSAYAFASAAWRMSEMESPADATAYVSVPANARVILPKGVASFGRGEAGTVIVNVVEMDPPA